MEKEFKPTYLYIKQHNKTGLKYFGKTSNPDPVSYPGSGVYWTRHLDIHSNDVTTEIYGYYLDVNILQRDAIEFSIKHNIVESKEWANHIVENGISGGDNSSCFTEESRKKIANSNKGINNPRSKLTESQVIEIYHSFEPPEKLKEKFKVGTGQIFGIKRKIYYKDITESITDFPGMYKGKKKIRYILQEAQIIDIFLKEETYEYFKQVHNASRQVVKNIKSRVSYKKVTEHLTTPGCVKKYNLTNQNTVDIFYSKKSLSELASQYGVHLETIRNIKNATTRKFFKDDF